MITFGTPFQSVNRMTFKMQNSFTFNDGMKWGLVRTCKVILLIIRGSRIVYKKKRFAYQHGLMEIQQ